MRLYVAGTHQRAGIGQRLLDDILADRPDAQRVRLWVLRGNAGALAFYEKQGFAVTGEAEEDGVWSLCLERDLS
jgi:ribosomal protein S18 acetylase RimI-like enzyme